MTPLGWGWAAFVWGYAIAWFLVADRVKLLAYRYLDPVKGDGKLDGRPDANADPKLTPQV
jgi:H+-transporting ATPase